MQIARDDARVDGTEAGERIERLERIVEIFAAVMNARQSWDIDEIIPEQFFPECLDGGDLREEAMSTDVEAVALVAGGLRDPAHHIGAFNHGDGKPALGEQVRDREVRRNPPMIAIWSPARSCWNRRVGGGASAASSIGWFFDVTKRTSTGCSRHNGTGRVAGCARGPAREAIDSRA